MTDNAKTFLFLIIGITAASFAAIFVRLSSAPPLVLSFWRMSLASLVLLPVVWGSKDSRGEIASLGISDLALIFLSGIFLGLHFASWISSLEFTSVASSIILVATQPIFVLIIEGIVFRKKPSGHLLSGVLVAVGGSILIGYGDLVGSEFSLFGDLLALGGAVALAAYFVIGREVRKRLANLPYIFLVYSTSALFLLVFCLIRGLEITDYSLYNFSLFVALAVLPTLVGHTSFNWALKRVSASVVGATMLGEPIVATLLAFLILGEVPTLYSLIGGVLVLFGIYNIWKRRMRIGR